MNNKRKILIGTRKSNLAKEQANLALKKLKRIGIKNYSIKYVVSKGDRVNLKDFKLEGGKGLFTKEIDNLLLNKKIDLAIHSTKDIPSTIDKRLTIAAFLKRDDVRDVLVTKNFSVNSILELKGLLSFGSSSPRRINYIKNLVHNVKIKNLRGNIESRIKKILDNKVDITLLANAGIKRLNLNNEQIKFIKVSTNIILPAPGQGAIAVICRKKDDSMLRICKKIDDINTRISISAERAFIKEINGNCFTPLGAIAKIRGRKLTIKGRLFSNDGKTFSEEKVVGSIKNAEKIGKLCARKILSNLKQKYD